MRRFRLATTAAILAALTLAGCRQAMDDQPRVEEFEASSVFADGRGARTPPENTIAALPPEEPPGAADAVATAPMPETAGEGVGEPDWPAEGLPASVRRGRELTEVLRRGAGRFEIYCAPCHGLAGQGDGMVARRGFPFPPSYHTPRLREKPLQYFFAVMTRGRGRMPSYGKMISADDRWAIAAYIRALQLSQHAPAHLLEPSDRQQLPEEP